MNGPRPEPRSLDIGEIARLAGEYQFVLDAKKAAIAPTTFAWYPYDSLGNFFNLAETLTGERRNMLDIIGKDPVLDVGCGDGDLAYFLESLGCRIHAVDHAPTNYNGMRGVWSMKLALESNVEIHTADIDTQFRPPVERYGATFLLGVLYHLKNPFLALETLARHCRYCFLSTRIGAVTPDGTTNFYDAPLAYLLAPGEANSDATNYWIFSDASLRRLLDRTHWEILDYKVFGHVESGGPSDHQTDLRAFCCMRSRLFDYVGNGRLLKGWHAIEEDTWRWTERQFSVEFASPPPRGVLTLRFALPDIAIEQLGSVTLNVTVNGAALPTATYRESGEHVYTCDVDSSGPALVEFEMDRALPPQPPDKRELSVMVLSVGILPAR